MDTNIFKIGILPERNVMMPIKFFPLLIVFFMTILVSITFAGTNSHKESMGPGFDCAKARTITEKTICSDEGLSSQDRQLYETYYDVQETLLGDPLANLIKTQHVFLKVRNRCGDNIPCIKKITWQRIEEVKAMRNKENPVACSENDIKADAEGRGPLYIDALKFGLKIQRAVKEKDLQALFALVDGELRYGPRKAFVKGKKFDDIFSPDWRRAVLQSQASCITTRNSDFDLGNGNIWFRRDFFDGKWKILTINGATESNEKIGGGVWTYKDKELTAACFTVPWLSGDNYEHYYEKYFGDKTDIHNYYHSAPYVETKNIPYDDFLTFIGKYIGKQVPIEPIPSPWEDIDGEKYLYLAVNLKKCVPASTTNDLTYEVVRNIPQRFCKTLAPNYPKSCHQLRLVEVTGPCGGSMGCDVNYAIYGIVDDPKTKEAYVVPLVNLKTLNDALNFVDELEK